MHTLNSFICLLYQWQTLFGAIIGASLAGLIGRPTGGLQSKIDSRIRQGGREYKLAAELALEAKKELDDWMFLRGHFKNVPKETQGA